MPQRKSISKKILRKINAQTEKENAKPAAEEQENPNQNK